MNRLDAAFTELKKQKRKGLITFIMAGAPSAEATGRMLAALPGAGADIIELGMPFSDPMADGPTIQEAGLCALEGGMTLKGVLQLARGFRAENIHTPLVLMGYYNPVYRYGVEAFCRDAVQAGADGVILVDLPPEEEEEFTRHSIPAGLQLIRLIAPTTSDLRVAVHCRSAGGFLYYIAVTGITGTKSADNDALCARVRELKAASVLPVAAGFGIRTPQQAAAVAQEADAVVVGSALVAELARSEQAALEFTTSLRRALDEI